MRVTKITGGPLPTTCYILTDDETGLSAVIDPGFEDPRLTEAVSAVGRENIKAILLTHGHFDHIMGVSYLKQLTGAKVYIYCDDMLFTGDSSLNLSSMAEPYGVEPFTADVALNDGDAVELGSLRIHVMHTPGHTVGTSCKVAATADCMPRRMHDVDS